MQVWDLFDLDPTLIFVDFLRNTLYVTQNQTQTSNKEPGIFPDPARSHFKETNSVIMIASIEFRARTSS